MNKKLSIYWLLALVAISVRGENSPPVEKTSPINCRINCRQDGQHIWAGVTFSNVTDSTVSVFNWTLLREKKVAGASFRVSRQGQEVLYTGILIKRSAPKTNEFYQMKSHKVYSTKIDLNLTRDFSKSGDYIVKYYGMNPSFNNSAFFVIESEPVIFSKK